MVTFTCLQHTPVGKEPFLHLPSHQGLPLTAQTERHPSPTWNASRQRCPDAEPPQPNKGSIQNIDGVDTVTNSKVTIRKPCASQVPSPSLLSTKLKQDLMAYHLIDYYKPSLVIHYIFGIVMEGIQITE